MSDEHLQASAGAELDLSSAMVQAERRHLDATVQALVKRLSSVPGLNVTVSRRHGKLRRLIGDLPYVNEVHPRTDPVHRIVVVVGRGSYWLDSDCGSIKCGREVASTKGGQQQEELPFSLWATTLFDEIARQNFVNHDSMVALRYLVEQDRAG